MNTRVLIGFILSLLSSAAWAQCGNGVPSAGNPGCIPPDVFFHQDNDGFSPSSPREVWEDRWGAIASDAQQGSGGTATGQRNQFQAEQTALTNCAKKGGENCKIIFPYRNQCAAAASSRDKAGFGRNSSRARAEAAAMEECNKVDNTGSCKIVYSDCSMPVRVQ